MPASQLMTAPTWASFGLVQIEHVCNSLNGENNYYMQNALHTPLKRLTSTLVTSTLSITFTSAKLHPGTQSAHTMWAHWPSVVGLNAPSGLGHNTQC